MTHDGDPPFSVAAGYHRFVREERYFCVILAHLLMQNSANVRTLFELIREQLAREGLPSFSSPGAEAASQAQIYLEFAFLRDRWNQFDLDPTENLSARNARKRAYLFALLARVDGLAALRSADLPNDVAEFNARFMGAAGLRVRHDIASPSQWRVVALYDLAGSVASSDEERGRLFRDLCRFKWAFRIQPDMVILLPGVQPVCIEAKLMSPEGHYPTDKAEARLFEQLFQPPEHRVRQIELQDFLFRVLLGASAQQVLISRGHGAVRMPGDGGRQLHVAALSWRQVFDRLECSPSLSSVADFLRDNIHIESTPLFEAGRGSQAGGRYFDGTANGLTAMLALIAERRQQRLRTEVGFQGGRDELRARTMESLEVRQWKWREPGGNEGRRRPANWIEADDFERIIEELQQEAAAE